MVLYIKTDTNQVQVDQCPRDLNKLLESCSSLNRRSKEFVSQPLKAITPKEGTVYSHIGDPNTGYLNNGTIWIADKSWFGIPMSAIRMADHYSNGIQLSDW